MLTNKSKANANANANQLLFFIQLNCETSTNTYN